MQVAEITKKWITDEGFAEKTHETQECRGTIIGLAIKISSVTADPTVKVTFRDADSCKIIPDLAFAALADGANHIFWFLSNQVSQDATENPVAVFGKLTVAITPEKDAGGSDQTLTVKVRIFIRQD